MKSKVIIFSWKIIKNHQNSSKTIKINDFGSQIRSKSRFFSGSGKRLFFLFWDQKFELGQSLDEDISKLRWSRIKNWVSIHAYATRTLTWTSFYPDPRNRFARKNKESFFSRMWTIESPKFWRLSIGRQCRNETKIRKAAVISAGCESQEIEVERKGIHCSSKWSTSWVQIC